MNHKLSLLTLLLGITTVFFGSPYILILFIFFITLVVFLKNKIENLIQLFFMFSFLIPYDFFYLTTGLKLGLIINHYFFAGLPLYFGLLKVLFSNNLFKYTTKINRNLFILILVIFFITTILPGTLFLIGAGGFSVRTALVLNYFNGLVLFLLITSIDISKSAIKNIFENIIIYGLILAIFGLFQYAVNNPIFTFFSFFDTERLSVFSLPDPIDGLPFLVFPFMISSLKILHNKKYTFYSISSTIILFISILLSFSRWAYMSLIITFVIYQLNISNNFLRLIKNYVIGIFVTSSFFLLMFFSGVFNSQVNRLESTDNLYVRAYLWGLGLTAVSSNPFLGYGIGNTTNIMFSSESNFNLLSEENSTKTIETFSQMGVHQFLIDLVIGQGLFILLLFIVITIMTIRNIGIREPIDSSSYFMHSIFLTFIFIIFFWLQNNGSQIFFIFLFWSLTSLKNYKFITKEII